MIKTHYNLDELRALFQKREGIQDASLVTSAGFSETSKFSRQARKTFSLVIAEDDLSIIQSNMQKLYSYILRDIKFNPTNQKPLPFDYIRVDAFYDQAAKHLQVLEINVRGAGMHEITELCDVYSSQVLEANAKKTLNEEIVLRQKIWQEATIGPVDRLLYVTKPTKARWIYYQWVEKLYDNVTYVTDFDNLKITHEGISYDNYIYKALIAKASNGIPDQYWELDKLNTISIIQPRIPRRVGLKDYLHTINLDCIPHSVALDSSKHDTYIDNKDLLVLKKSSSNSSLGVVVGRDVSPIKWSEELAEAYLESDEWLMQDFVEPGEGIVLAHDDTQLKNNKVLLGIFLLPDTTDPFKVVIDFSVKLYNGEEKEIIFDPASEHDDIWFGNVIVTN